MKAIHVSIWLWWFAFAEQLYSWTGGISRLTL
jgi:hypothetical protein